MTEGVPRHSNSRQRRTVEEDDKTDVYCVFVSVAIIISSESTNWVVSHESSSTSSAS